MKRIQQLTPAAAFVIALLMIGAGMFPASAPAQPGGVAAKEGPREIVRGQLAGQRILGHIHLPGEPVQLYRQRLPSPAAEALRGTRLLMHDPNLIRVLTEKTQSIRFIDPVGIHVKPEVDLFHVGDGATETYQYVRSLFHDGIDETSHLFAKPFTNQRNVWNPADERGHLKESLHRLLTNLSRMGWPDENDPFRDYRFPPVPTPAPNLSTNFRTVVWSIDHDRTPAMSIVSPFPLFEAFCPDSILLRLHDALSSLLSGFDSRPTGYPLSYSSSLHPVSMQPCIPSRMLFPGRDLEPLSIYRSDPAMSIRRSSGLLQRATGSMFPAIRAAWVSDRAIAPRANPFFDIPASRIAWQLQETRPAIVDSCATRP
jgi:hypothetical protein